MSVHEIHIMGEDFETTRCGLPIVCGPEGTHTVRRYSRNPEEATYATCRACIDSLPGPNREQHFTLATDVLRQVLAKIDLTGKRVIEIGAGHGELTVPILERNPASVLAFEIEPGLCKLQDPRLELREMDVTASGLTVYDKDCLISVPPYSLLPWIIENILPFAHDAILMVPPREGWEATWLKDFTLEAELPGTAFDPPSRGSHLIVKRGFKWLT